MVKNRNTNKNGASPRRNALANGKILKKTIGKPRPIVDARQKIIQKKRTNVVDARDVLASMAKTQDARAKLQKLRGLPAAKSPSTVKQIGKHILQKTDKNGKIMLVTNKNKAAANISSKVREQLGIAKLPPRRKAPLPVVSKRKEPTGPLQLRRTIDNDFVSPMIAAGGYYPHPHTMYTAQPAYAMPPMVHAIEMRRPPMEMPMRGGGGGGGSSGGVLNDGSSGTWKTYASPMRSSNGREGGGGFMEVDSDDEMRSPRAGSSRTASSSVHSRLDGTPTSHGILAQPKAKIVVPVGHRIVVSNLQSTVTQDDIRELFEDIGQLLVARLVRPGTAEVIYKNLKDAQKAVDTYHNRQLDGQPMKCLLVNKRPLNNPTGPAIKSSDVVRKQISSSKAEKLVPDLSTIHKVLFQRH